MWSIVPNRSAPLRSLEIHLRLSGNDDQFQIGILGGFVSCRVIRLVLDGPECLLRQRHHDALTCCVKN